MEQNPSSHQFAMPKVIDPEDPDQILGENSDTNNRMRVGNYTVDIDNLIMKSIPVLSRLGVPVDTALRKNFDLGINSYMDKLSANPSPNSVDEADIRIPYNLRWLKVDLDLSNCHPNVHICMMTLLSDYRFLGTGSLPHFWGKNYGKNKSEMMVSLDHSIRIHTPMRADQWLLFEVTSPRSGNGRGYAEGKFFDRQGVLVASITQEHLWRTSVTSDKVIPNLQFSLSPPVLVDQNTNSKSTKQIRSKL
ncbi:hypothetical protein BB559_000706 [Furculomyces boomerangus]|uniref:Acyl-CoA thioesterase-like C-terminal domain-containing protein n=2 Tax=Harpellales TaxID=61421 RepID=A0A2T9YE73_9FUNG|nr:hypothetical protein BB559_004534 [Furculomyces boomerangus]PVU99458.1 hypothetical protein BB559_000706 [Furculomyces boomerangus]